MRPCHLIITSTLSLRLSTLSYPPLCSPGCARHNRLQRPRHCCREPLGGAAGSDASGRLHRQPRGRGCVFGCWSSGAHRAQLRRLRPCYTAAADAPCIGARSEAAAAGPAQHGTVVGHSKVRARDHDGCTLNSQVADTLAIGSAPCAWHGRRSCTTLSWLRDAPE